MRTLDNYEYLQILNELDFRHGSFYHLWEMGRPLFVEGERAKRIPTGAVSFKRDDGKYLEFLINEGYWKSLNLHQKAFLIAHECLHVTYNHGYRLFRHAKTQLDVTLMNWACDIVINHRLLELGFDRAEIDPEGAYCWIDTVFKDRVNSIAENRSSEYYYNKLIEMNKEKVEKLRGTLKTVDQHQIDDLEEEEEELDPEQFDDMTEIIEELTKRMSVSEMNEVAEDFERRHKELDEQLNEQNPVGTEPGKMLKCIDPSTIVRPKPKWESVIKKWAQKTILDEFKVDDSWARTARRFQFVSNSDLMIPSEMETNDPFVEKNKIKVFFFLDTSASCVSYAERFWKAAKSVPTNYFDIRLFCFDTQVYETSLESGKLYGFGGTAFYPIEQKIQSIIRDEDAKYPGAVFLLTDGYGNYVYPQYANRWHWFMTPAFSQRYVPKDSYVHRLENFE